MLENKELRRLLKKLSQSLSYLIERKLQTSSARHTPVAHQTYQRDLLLQEKLEANLKKQESILEKTYLSV